MEDESKNIGDKPGNEISDKAEELIEKSKDFADKAEDLFAETISKAMSSDTFVKVSNFFGKVEDFIEEKATEFQSGEMSAKFDAFREKTEDQANELLKKVKDAGLKIGDQVDESLDVIKGKKEQTNNQDGEGI